MSAPQQSEYFTLGLIFVLKSLQINYCYTLETSRTIITNDLLSSDPLYSFSVASQLIVVNPNCLYLFHVSQSVTRSRSTLLPFKPNTDTAGRNLQCSSWVTMVSYHASSHPRGFQFGVEPLSLLDVFPRRFASREDIKLRYRFKPHWNPLGCEEAWSDTILEL